MFNSKRAPIKIVSIKATKTAYEVRRIGRLHWVASDDLGRLHCGLTADHAVNRAVKANLRDPLYPLLPGDEALGG